MLFAASIAWHGPLVALNILKSAETANLQADTNLAYLEVHKAILIALQKHGVHKYGTGAHNNFMYCLET